MQGQIRMSRARSGSGVAVALVALMCLASTGWSQTRIRTFVLESVNPVQTYGPYDCRQGVPVDTKEGVFILSCPSPGQIEFVQVATGRRYGPYDFVEGRIVTIGESAYTLAGFGQRMGRTSPAPVPPSRSVRTPPVLTPSAEPVPQPRPPDRPVPSTGVGPSTRKPAPPPAPPADRGTPFADVFGTLDVGVGIGLLDSEQYDWSRDGAPGGDEITVDRTSLSLMAGGDWLSLHLGFVYDAEMDGEFEDDAGGSFMNGEAADGSGWWLALRGYWDLWRWRAWRIDGGGTISYRTEEYALSYDSYVSRDVDVVVTNGLPDDGEEAADGGEEAEPVTETITLWQTVRVGDDLTLTETAVSANLRAIYEMPGSLDAYVGVRVLAYSRTDIDGDVSGYLGDFDLEFERTGVVSAMLGISRSFAGMRWYADAIAGPDSRVIIGLTREF